MPYPSPPCYRGQVLRPKNYLINKYFGGSFMLDKVKDIDFELEQGFEFGYKTFFGGNKKGITIIKKR